MKRLRVGVIGTGRMGRNHCRVYASMRNVQLVGVFDQDRYSADWVASQYNAARFAEVDNLINEVDAVSIATPTATHFNIAMHCLQQGVHVLVEKPIATAAAQGEALAEVARMNELVLHVGHIERFNPAYRELKTQLNEQLIYSIDMRRLSPYLGSNTDTDVVLDLMTHDIDLALDLAGELPASISAHGIAAHNGDHHGEIDHAVAHLRFPSGILVNLTASRLIEQKVRSIEVIARDAFIATDLLSKSVTVHRNMVSEWPDDNSRLHRYREESIIERIQIPSFEPLYLELQHFIDAITGQRLSQSSTWAGINALRLAEKIRWAVNQHLVQRGMELVA